jgi:hypothetical protein
MSKNGVKQRGQKKNGNRLSFLFAKQGKSHFLSVTLTCTSVAGNPIVSNLRQADMRCFGRASTHFHKRFDTF